MNGKEKKVIKIQEIKEGRCGICGKQKKDLNGSKIYECKKCNIKIDRDINGARNILIRLLSEE